MILHYFQKRFALSQKGANDLFKGVIFTTLLNIALMLPAAFTYFFLKDYLTPLLEPGTSSIHGIGFYIGLALFLGIIMYLIARIQYWSTYTKIYDESATRRISLAEKLRKLPLAFFGEKNLSDLTATIMDDSTQLEQTFSHAIPQLIASFLSVTLIGIGLFFFNWQLALALLWVVPVALLIIAITKRKMLQKHYELYKTKRDVSENIQGGLENIQEIKAYNLHKNYTDKLDNQLNILEKTLINSELIVGSFLNISYIILKLGIATVLITGVILVANHSVDLFTFLIFLILGASIYNPITEVFNHLAVLIHLDIRINRMKEMENMPTQQGKTTFKPKHFDITFKNVSFEYESNKRVIDHLSFTAHQGETTALIGPSGGGKSTTAKLAARFWDIQKGTILLGGEDISKIDPETLLQYYSVVFQDVVLFNTSILENIRMGNKSASDQEVYHVAKLAQCDAFIQALPNKYETRIGENGDNLSGGERQRISIARALLKDAPIVLLDEATASLDVENETKIQKALSALIQNKTVLIIAHRMRTVANADKIIVLSKGAIIESGSPQELLEQKGWFYHTQTCQANTQ